MMQCLVTGTQCYMPHSSTCHTDSVLLATCNLISVSETTLRMSNMFQLSYFLGLYFLLTFDTNLMDSLLQVVASAALVSDGH